MHDQSNEKTKSAQNNPENNNDHDQTTMKILIDNMEGTLIRLYLAIMSLDQ
jgi:hypothetical protein